MSEGDSGSNIPSATNELAELRGEVVFILATEYNLSFG